jgi:hypothetical protein
MATIVVHVVPRARLTEVAADALSRALLRTEPEGDAG